MQWVLGQCLTAPVHDEGFLKDILSNPHYT